MYANVHQTSQSHVNMNTAVINNQVNPVVTHTVQFTKKSRLPLHSEITQQIWTPTSIIFVQKIIT